VKPPKQIDIIIIYYTAKIDDMQHEIVNNIRRGKIEKRR